MKVYKEILTLAPVFMLRPYKTRRKTGLAEKRYVSGHYRS
jgi:hypothetical protein